MKEPKWIGKPVPEKQSITNFQEILNINGVPFDETITTLLLQRNIDTYDKAKVFFKGNIAELHDPFLMADMDKAVKRLSQQIEANKNILIFGDYDVDGTTSVALVYLFLKNNFPELNPIYYIPDREAEGYGISTKGIDFAKENDCSLMIALDCGIKAVDKVEYAKKNGVDVIICDHHTPGDKLPDAIAVLDPKRADCQYPYKELSGCGVGFKLLQAFSMANDIPLENLFSLIDLLALSIASDIVPITGENRILCKAGIEKLSTDPLPGIKAIMEQTSLTGKRLRVSDLVFKIGPRINASGRMVHGSQSVKLLIGEDIVQLDSEANAINDLNTKRKAVDTSIKNEVIEMVKQIPDYEERKSIVLYKDNWHKGVLGIVASRIVDEFYKPTILLAESDGILVGSARSVEGFNLYKAIDACKENLQNYGGHEFAAGLTLKLENFENFRQQFETVVSHSILQEQTEPKLHYDLEIPLSKISWNFYRLLEKMRPYGPENMTPVFVTKGLRDTGRSKVVGNNEHLQLVLTDGNSEVKAIAFNMADNFPLLKNNQVKICYTINENNFRGTTTLQLVVKAIAEDS